MGFVYLSDKDLIDSWDGNIEHLLNLVSDAFISWKNDEIILPGKSSQIIDPTNQSRVNCMPCTMPKIGFSGVKLVSVFPDNPLYGLPNVSGALLLLDATNGTPVAVMGAEFITSLRTALVGALAARHLAPREPQEIALVGSGEQAFMHLVVLASLFPSLKSCRVASRTSESERRFIGRVCDHIPGLHLDACSSNYEAAVREADIVVTALSSQVPILKASWIKEGSLYIHVGGVEDEYGVAEKANKIVCDNWEALKHRGSPTISHMYSDGLLTDEDIYAELAEIIAGEKPGRESDSEFIYFNSIGLAFTDICVAAALYHQSEACGRGMTLEEERGSLFDNESFAAYMQAIRSN